MTKIEGRELSDFCPSAHIFLQKPVLDAQNGGFQKNRCVRSLNDRKKRFDSECITANLNKSRKYRQKRASLQNRAKKTQGGKRQHVPKTYQKSDACILMGRYFLTFSERKAPLS